MTAKFSSRLACYLFYYEVFSFFSDFLPVFNFIYDFFVYAAFLFEPFFYSGIDLLEAIGSFLGYLFILTA